MWRFLFLAALLAAPGHAQLFNPSAASVAPVDLTPYATKTDMTAATAPLATKAEVTAATAGVVKTVNAATPDGSGNIAISIPSVAGLVTTSQLSAATAPLATASALSTVQATIPTPSAVVPPGVADAGAAGNMTTVYALGNHTHASKARKGRDTTLANGTKTIALSPAFSATPVCAVVAEAADGETAIVNAQLDGPPTVSQLKVRVNRSAAQLVGLLGLTINVVQTPVATVVDYICVEP